MCVCVCMYMLCVLLRLESNNQGRIQDFKYKGEGGPGVVESGQNDRSIVRKFFLIITTLELLRAVEESRGRLLTPCPPPPGSAPDNSSLVK